MIEKVYGISNFGNNKKIIDIKLSDDKIIINFPFDQKMEIYDNGQSCCENRFISTDDDINYFKNSILINIELNDAPNINEEYGSHEVQFLVLNTSKGNLTFQTHNIHNGYYGGFSVYSIIECNSVFN